MDWSSGREKVESKDNQGIFGRSTVTSPGMYI